METSSTNYIIHFSILDTIQKNGKKIQNRINEIDAEVSNLMLKKTKMEKIDKDVINAIICKFFVLENEFKKMREKNEDIEKKFINDISSMFLKIFEIEGDILNLYLKLEKENAVIKSKINENLEIIGFEKRRL